MSTRNQSNNPDSVATGYIRIGVEFRQDGIYVPHLRQKELASYLAEVRNQAELAAELAAQNAVAPANLQVECASSVAPEVMAESVTPRLTPADSLDAAASFYLVPCINQDDVNAQHAAADANSKFSERDRTTAMKNLTRRLLDRPMTRKVGVPRDVQAAMQRLAAVAPHIPELVEALRIPLLVAAATGAPPMVAPLLLVGPAGVGKSYVALQIAEILGVTAHTLSYAASGSAGNMLSGADKNWGNSSTGIVFNILTEREFANPVICLDELDKAGISQVMQGADRNSTNELLALLEPLTAAQHRDRCAEIRVDARHIVWIATANSLEGLSAPLLSRFKLILVNKPDARSAVTIALSVAQAVSAQMGIQLKPPSGEVLQLLATLTPRTMRRIWTGAGGWAAANGHDRVTMNDIEQSLGITTPVPTLLH